MCICAVVLAAQTEDQRFNEIKAKHDSGEIAEENRNTSKADRAAYNQEESAKRQADYAKGNPPRESIGLIHCRISAGQHTKANREACTREEKTARPKPIPAESRSSRWTRLFKTFAPFLLNYFQRF
jgi:hypothetical protein